MNLRDSLWRDLKRDKDWSSKPMRIYLRLRIETTCWSSPKGTCDPSHRTKKTQSGFTKLWKSWRGTGSIWTWIQYSIAWETWKWPWAKTHYQRSIGFMFLPRITEKTTKRYCAKPVGSPPRKSEAAISDKDALGDQNTPKGSFCFQAVKTQVQNN